MNNNNLALHEIVRPVIAIVPAAKTDGSTTNAQIISLRNTQKLGIFVNNGAGGTLTITASQCSAVAGTGAKALTFDKAMVGNNTTDAMTQSTGLAGTLTLGPSKYATIDIDPSTLDIANSFDCVRLNVVVAGTVTINAQYWLKDRRYDNSVAPDSLTD